MDALAFIEKATKTKPAALFALTGDEDFLKRQAQVKLVADMLDDADPEFAMTTFAGDVAVWSTIKSELDTLPFVGPRRVVLIEQADPFVTANRSQLEKYVAAEGNRGVLLLDVKSWPGNTKLAKATTATTIVAKAPERAKMRSWCQARAKSAYDSELANDAAEWLIELVGGGLGQIDQELAKLATFAGAGKKITRELVEKMVGRTRQAETFKIFDAIGSGQTAVALTILQRLYEQGEQPIALLGAFSWQLRRLGAVSRLARRSSLPQAFDQLGVSPFFRNGLEQQLRHLGRARMDRLYDWMIETDLAMKGSSPLAPELILERLVVKLARVEKPTAARR